MSSPEKRVALTEKARRDLADIWVYGAQEWGEPQAERYGARWDRATQWLASFPLIGRERTEVASDLRVHVVQQHAILYRIKDDTVRIYRIVRSSIALERLAIDEED